MPWALVVFVASQQAAVKLALLTKASYGISLYFCMALAATAAAKVSTPFTALSIQEEGWEPVVAWQSSRRNITAC